MRIDLIGALVGVVLGAAATALIARASLGSAASDTLKRIGVPVDALGGAGGNPLDTLAKIDPAGATQLETAAAITAVGGALAAVAGYVLVQNLRGD